MISKSILRPIQRKVANVSDQIAQAPSGSLHIKVLAEGASAPVDALISEDLASQLNGGRIGRLSASERELMKANFDQLRPNLVLTVRKGRTPWLNLINTPINPTGSQVSVNKKDWIVKESELDNKQLEVLKATNDKSLIVSGCAGSGKSVLALIKAQRIQREKGNNYQIIVFTKSLCKYMNSGKDYLGLNDKFFYYHWEWVNRRCKPHSDYVIVDEIQDFTEEEIMEFVNATNKHFFFFGDTAQSIYEGLKDTIHVEDIEECLNKDVKSIKLFYNYRLPKPVAKLVQHVGVDLEKLDINKYKSQETEIPRLIKYDNLEKQVEAIARLINNGVISDVGILLPTNDEVLLIYKMLHTKGINLEIKYNDEKDWRDSLDFSTTNTKVMTYHSAKGLQFGAVILPNVQELTSDCSRKSLYVAMTRTYRNLYIMYSGNLPTPLSNIPSNLYKKTETDKVEAI